MTEPLAYLNGEFVAFSQARVSIVVAAVALSAAALAPGGEIPRPPWIAANDFSDLAAAVDAVGDEDATVLIATPRTVAKDLTIGPNVRDRGRRADAQLDRQRVRRVHDPAPPQRRRDGDARHHPSEGDGPDRPVGLRHHAHYGGRVRHPRDRRSGDDAQSDDTQRFEGEISVLRAGRLQGRTRLGIRRGPRDTLQDGRRSPPQRRVPSRRVLAIEPASGVLNGSRRA